MFTGFAQVSAQDVREISSVQQMPLGQAGVTRDGRVYRYAKAGAADLAPGKLCVNADLEANHTNQAVAAAAAVGATEVSVTLGATAATADQYKEGLLVINDANGEGCAYKIAGHAAIGSGGTGVIKLEEPIKVALTTSSEYTLKASNFSGVVISATDQADLPVGVPNVTITAGYYGWLQVFGECAILADEAVTKGLALTIGTGTAGAVEALDGAGEVQIGVASEALVDTEYRSSFLQMI